MPCNFNVKARELVLADYERRKQEAEAARSAIALAIARLLESDDILRAEEEQLETERQVVESNQWASTNDEAHRALSAWGKCPYKDCRIYTQPSAPPMPFPIPLPPSQLPTPPSHELSPPLIELVLPETPSPLSTPSP